MEGLIEFLPLLMFLALAIFLFSGFPVAFVLAGTGLLFWVWAVSMGLVSDKSFLLVTSRIYGSVVDNLVLVAIPMFIFMGNLIEDERYTSAPEHLKETFWREGREERRALLFPFLWSVIASEGVLIGDRTQNSLMNLTNHWWFSYPGYNEILTGKSDPSIDSNDKNWNHGDS